MIMKIQVFVLGDIFCLFYNQKLISKSKSRTEADIQNVIIRVFLWILQKRHMIN